MISDLLKGTLDESPHCWALHLKVKLRLSLELFRSVQSSDSVSDIYTVGILLLFKTTVCALRVSVKLNQILGVNLIAVENDVDLWVGHVVHAAVVKVGEAGILGGRPAVHGVAHRVLPDEHSGQEHGFVGRLAGKYGRG